MCSVYGLYPSLAHSSITQSRYIECCNLFQHHSEYRNVTLVCHFPQMQLKCNVTFTPKITSLQLFITIQRRGCSIVASRIMHLMSEILPTLFQWIKSGQLRRTPPVASSISESSAAVQRHMMKPIGWILTWKERTMNMPQKLVTPLVRVALERAHVMRGACLGKYTKQSWEINIPLDWAIIEQAPIYDVVSESILETMWSKTVSAGKQHSFHLGRCVCMTNEDWGVDHGYFTETKKLPVRVLTFTDTGADDEYMYFWLGPLLCYQGLYPHVIWYFVQNQNEVQKNNQQ